MGLFSKILDAIRKALNPPKPPAPPPPLPPDPDGHDSIVVELLNAHNLERGAARVGLLVLETDLNQAAGKHAVWMASNDLLSHVGQGGNDISRRVRAEGYYYLTVGENIAEGFTTVEAVVNGWMNSSGHRKNILNPTYREVGFGVARSDSGDLYWCAVFGWRATLMMPSGDSEVSLGGALYAKSEPDEE